jgi:phage-related protein (TIGR01555 family)
MSEPNELNQDGYTNPFTGAGIFGEDKSTGVSYQIPLILQRTELEARFRTDWLSKKIVAKPASDAVKKFITIVDGGEVEEALVAIKAKTQLKTAATWARLFGGAAIIVVLEDGLTSEDPVDLNRIKSIKSLEVMDRWDVIPLDGSAAVESEFYRINNVIWHKTRVLRVNGASLSRNQMIRELGWGGSVLDSVDEAIKALMIQYTNIGHIMAEHSVAILKTKGFANAGNGGAIRTAIQTRLDNLSSSKSMYRTIMLDAQEEYDMITRTLTGLDDITNIFVTQVSAAAEIPEMVLFGKSPAGLNATQAEQMDSYYDTVSSVQDTLDDAVSALVTMVASSLGVLVPVWQWTPLGELTETEQAEVRLKNAQALSAEVLAMQLSDDEARVVAKAASANGIFDSIDEVV